MNNRKWISLTAFIAVVLLGTGLQFGKGIAQGVASAVSLFYNGAYVSSTNPLPVNITGGTFPPLQLQTPVAITCTAAGTTGQNCTPGPANTNGDQGIAVSFNGASPGASALPVAATDCTYPCGFPTPPPHPTASPLANQGQSGIPCYLVTTAGACGFPMAFPILLTVNGTNASAVIGSVSAGQSLYLGGFSVSVNATASPNFEIEYSTGSSTCAGLTQASNIITAPAITPVPTPPVVWTGLPVYTSGGTYGSPIAVSSPGTTLCYHNGGTNPSESGVFWGVIF